MYYVYYTTATRNSKSKSYTESNSVAVHFIGIKTCYNFQISMVVSDTFIFSTTQATQFRDINSRPNHTVHLPLFADFRHGTP